MTAASQCSSVSLWGRSVPMRELQHQWSWRPLTVLCGSGWPSTNQGTAKDLSCDRKRLLDCQDHGFVDWFLADSSQRTVKNPWDVKSYKCSFPVPFSCDSTQPITAYKHEPTRRGRMERIMKLQLWNTQLLRQADWNVSWYCTEHGQGASGLPVLADDIPVLITKFQDFKYIYARKFKWTWSVYKSQIFIGDMIKPFQKIAVLKYIYWCIQWKTRLLIMMIIPKLWMLASVTDRRIKFSDLSAESAWSRYRTGISRLIPIFLSNLDMKKPQPKDINTWTKGENDRVEGTQSIKTMGGLKLSFICLKDIHSFIHNMKG